MIEERLKLTSRNENKSDNGFNVLHNFRFLTGLKTNVTQFLPLYWKKKIEPFLIQKKYFFISV